MIAHRTAAVNAGRAALLVAALGERPELLVPATFDLLHQPYRAQAMAPSCELMTRLRDLGHAALISGAGPTVLTLANGAEHAGRVAAAIEEIAADAASPAHEYQGRTVTWRVHVLRVPEEGAKERIHAIGPGFASVPDSAAPQPSLVRSSSTQVFDRVASLRSSSA